MSLEVQQFLNDTGGNFTEMAPRPPVPGEETAELQSNGGLSTRSSGSHKSHLSGRSHSSSKSVTSHRSDVSHSPAATPRRSNLDKTLCASSLSFSDSKLDADCEEAPLGFEPEGSVANSPPFTENSTPPYLKWAENLNYLLDDSDGVKLFKQFLDQDHCSNLLDFWFACKGLKMVGEDGLERLLKLIYKKYIKGDQLTLRLDIKKNIVDHLKREHYSQSLFDEAQTEVETLMKNDAYPLFLKSDIYLQYVRNGGDSPKTSNNSSGSSSARPLSGPLPTLREDEMLSTDDLKRQANPALPLTPASLMHTCRSREVWSSRKPESVYPPSNAKVPNPYHTSYAPVSAQDSELQSLSSDALTDDTMSLTDSSVDGRDFSGYGKKAWRKHQKAIKRYADTNKVTHLNQHLIPRTERAPKDRNLAEKEPEKFADMLIERLQKVKNELDKLERMKENLQSLETDEEKDSVLMPPPSGCPPVKQATGANPLGVLLAMADSDREDNAQNILEEHVSRIWDSSNGQTPSRSPGRHSPPKFMSTSGHDLSFKYPYAPGPSPNVSGTNLLPAFTATPKAPSSSSRRKDKDSGVSGISSINTAGSGPGAYTYDSGITDDKSSSGVFYELEPPHHKYVYHHHHHHHHVVKDSSSGAGGSAGKSRPIDSDPSAAYNRSLHCHVSAPSLPNYTDAYSGHRGAPHNTHGHVWDATPSSQSRGKDSKRSSGSKKSGAMDSSSNMDSGLGLGAMDSTASTPMSQINTPANEKVMAWMLENEKMTMSSTQYSTDGSDKGSSQKRSSHKSSTNSQHKSAGNTTKKSSAPYSSSGRSGSLDRSGYNSYHQPVGGDYSMHSVTSHGSGGGVMPGQPIMQDPSMPPLNPPNPMTQIEEAKRRLEVESNRANMRLSKSFTAGSSSSSSSRDRRAMPPPPQSYSTGGAARGANTTLPAVVKASATVTPQLAPLDLSSSEEHSSHGGSHKSEGSSHRHRSKKAAAVSSTPSTPAGGAPSQPATAQQTTIVGYYFCAEPIPYRTTLPGKNITLAQFKQLISKKGNYRFFFKTISDEFDSGVVHEEVIDDDQVLPLWDNKIIGKVEKKE